MDHNAAFKELTKRSGVILRGHGFKGSGQNFKRDRGEVWQGINFQKTQWRIDSTHPISFTLNLALRFPRVPCQRPFTGDLTFEKFTPAKGDQILRIGQFLSDPRDHWWDVDGATFEIFWPRFAEVLVEAAIPAMETMKTREGLAAVFRRMPWMANSPAARAWLGDLAPPVWEPADRDAGRWKQDERGQWWGPGEW